MATQTNEAMEIGAKLVELCKAGNGMQAIEELYADDIVSVEAFPAPGMEQTMSGKAAVKGKNEWWYENHEVHGVGFDGPYPNGDRFIVAMSIDVTPKAGPMAGNRMQMEEMGLYTVAGGKIVREEFFYSMG